MKEKYINLIAKILLISTFVILTFLDCYTTYLGYHYEVNPVVVFFLDNHLFILVKILGLLPIVLGILVYDKTNKFLQALFGISSCVWTVGMIYVVINNFYVLSQI